MMNLAWEYHQQFLPDAKHILMDYNIDAVHVVIPNHQSTNFGVIPPIWTVIYIHLQGMAAEVAKRDMSRNRGYCTPKSHHWWSLFKLTQKGAIHPCSNTPM